ncbi:hypothetical protein BDE36_4243 [Arcticibacter tournemirensis]|uniref:hypothetical protein n=1 Tax=Arcticibacter tournemirensis TaxID=699437 RepID=UPI001173C00F|nr:hypothetical protein [Arcticibacter tournemirensis]TQM52427.1 hypothetical protein BDE36_4243 [Arcticibacter tournemirensis]
MGNSVLKISAIRCFQLITIIFFLQSGKVFSQFPEILIPKDVIVQHAGSIGYFSVGAGYRLFKNKRGNLDFNYGFVPENKGGTLHIISAKFVYRPFEIKLKDWAKLYPLNPGAFVSYHYGKEFDFYWDKSQYDEGYYWWSSAIRPHISFSNEIKLDSKKLFGSGKIKSLSIYSEFNTNDLYMVSYVLNTKDLSLTDIFKLGIGIRLGF